MNVLVVEEDKELVNEICGIFRKVNCITNFTFMNSGDELLALNNNLHFDYAFLSLDIISKKQISLCSCLIKNLYGISSSGKKISAQINNPSFKKFFKKPINISCLTKYLEVYENLNFIEDDSIINKYNLLDSLSRFGFNINHEGTAFLADCIANCFATSDFNLEKTYESVANAKNISSDKVKWGIINAINYVNKATPQDVLEKKYNMSKGRTLTPKFLLKFYVNELNLSRDAI